MDAFLRREFVVFLKSSQVGATEALNNMLGYIIDQDPGPTMVIQPTIEMAKTWAKDRFEPMLRDTPALSGKVTDRAKDADNTILHKKFAGGHVTCVGANSAVNLRSRPIRNLLADEVDIYPASAGTSGDPLQLGIKRTKAFRNRRIFVTSTPTIRGMSRIEAAFEQSDQQHYMLPCPHCGERQRLEWAQLHWLRELADGRRVPARDKKYEGRGKHLPETAVYVCEHCGAEIEHVQKARMLARGEWQPSKPGASIAGFRINELYSPVVTWAEMVQAWIEAKPLPETLKTFVNEALGETWEESGDEIESTAVMDRREAYIRAPVEAVFVTAGVDVQDDRLEVEVVAWGKSFESWALEWRQFIGDTSTSAVWAELDEFLKTARERDDGALLPITSTAVDSGFRTDEVYRFCKSRFRRNVFAVKGKGGLGVGDPIVSRPTSKNKARCRVFTINTDQCKDRLFEWLALERPGPGFQHFPTHFDDEFFWQLAAERRVYRQLGGQRVRQYRQRRERNEALDLHCYNVVALEIRRGQWDKACKRGAATMPKPDSNTTENSPQMGTNPAAPRAVRRGARPPRRGSWATRY